MPLRRVSARRVRLAVAGASETSGFWLSATGCSGNREAARSAARRWELSS